MNIYSYIKESFKSAKELIISDYNNSYLEKIVFSWSIVNEGVKSRKYIKFPLLLIGMSIIYFSLAWISKNINLLTNNGLIKIFDNLDIQSKEFFGFLDFIDNIQIISMTFSTCYLFLFGFKAFLPTLTNFIPIDNKLVLFFINLFFPILIFAPVPYLNMSVGSWILEFIFTFCIDCFLEGGIHKFGIEHLHIWINISSSLYFISMVFVSLVRLAVSLDTASYIANKGYTLNGKDKEKNENRIKEYTYSRMKKISVHLNSKMNTMLEFADIFKILSYILKGKNNKHLDENKKQRTILKNDIENQNFGNLDNQKINRKSMNNLEKSKRKRRAKNKRSRKARRKHKK